MGLWADLLGTTKSIFRLGKSGVALKDSSGNLLVRNSADSADSAITISKPNISGNVIDINSAAASTGADWKMTLARPSSGMTAATTFTFPTTAGTAGQAVITDGSGNLSFTTITSAQSVNVDTTTLAFNSSSPVTMFTLPANAVVHETKVIVDTAFDGTPTMTVGKAGSTSKYMGSTDNDLTSAAKTEFAAHVGEAPIGSTEALIITYSAGSATVGAARVEVHYSVPV